MNNKYTEKQKQDGYLRREFYMKKGYEDAKQNNPLHIKSCMLYWAEGSKKSTTFEFTNCDPMTHIIMLQFLRTYFPDKENKIRGMINFYPTPNNLYEEVLKYWINIANIPPSQFTKPTDRSRYYKLPKNNKYPNGIFRLSVNSVEIIYYVYGAINFYAGKNIFNPNTGRVNNFGGAKEN